MGLKLNTKHNAQNSSGSLFLLGESKSGRGNLPYALPLLNLPNAATDGLKGALNDGTTGISFKKVGAYLGYRILVIPSIIFNAVSAVVSLVLSLITIPLAICKCSRPITRYFTHRMIDSVKRVVHNITIDLTCEVRVALGSCCCADSAWTKV